MPQKFWQNLRILIILNQTLHPQKTNISEGLVPSAARLRGGTMGSGWLLSALSSSTSKNINGVIIIWTTDRRRMLNITEGHGSLSTCSGGLYHLCLLFCAPSLPIPMSLLPRCNEMAVYPPHASCHGMLQGILDWKLKSQNTPFPALIVCLHINTAHKTGTKCLSGTDTKRTAHVHRQQVPGPLSNLSSNLPLSLQYTYKRLNILSLGNDSRENLMGSSKYRQG